MNLRQLTQTTPYPVTTIAIIAVCVIWALVSGQGFGFSTASEILAQGGNFGPYTLNGQPWRLVTSLFTHGGLIHLLLNMLALYTLGRVIEPAIGHFGFFLLFLVCGLAGNLLSLYWNMFLVSAGASGAIFGIFGFDLILTVASMRNEKHEVWRTLLTSGIYVALIILIGMVFPFDNAAHLGGLTCGIMIGIIACFFSHIRINHAFIVAFVFLIIVFFLLPRFQVRHFNDFNALMQADDRTTQLASAFKSDEQALEGFIGVKAHYDSIVQLLSDSLKHAPASVIEDRESLYDYAMNRSEETAYKIKLLREKSYRYLDSLEIVQGRGLSPLNHNLSLEESSDTPSTSPPGELVKTWYDEEWKETVNIQRARYFRIGYKDSVGRWNGRVEDYYIEGAIQMKGYYSSGIRDGVFRYYNEDSTYSACGEYSEEIRTGFWEFFHENGKLSEVRNFADNNYLLSAWNEEGEQVVENGNGEIISYYSNNILQSYMPYSDGLADGTAYGNYGNGRLKFKEIYDAGELIRGQSYSENGTNTYDKSTYYPFPVGGMKKFTEYVSTQTTSSSLPPGQVRLLFTCPPSGKIYDIRVWKSVSDLHDSTAIAILKEGPSWNAAKEHGLDPYTSEGAVTIVFD